MNYTFELKELQATHIVYLHHQGDMSLIPSSIRKLMQWAGPKGLINGPANKLISVYQHEGKELSVDIGLTVPQEVEGESEIYQSIPLDQHPQDKCMIDLCIPVQMIDLKLIEEKAISILTECDTAMLASVTEDGYPRPVPMGKIKADGISQIWFSTGTFSDKTIQFQLNPKAGVCFMKGGDSIVLTGKVEIVSDMEIKKALWSDWMFAHFPGGVIDPSYCILKFTSEEATYWIDNEFVKASI